MRTFSDVSKNKYLSGILYDSSVYIASWRQADYADLDRQLTYLDKRPVFLSSVVLEELYVGATNARVAKHVARIESQFKNVNRLLIPNLTDWITTGQILSKIGQKYGFELVKLSRMTNDCLIAVSACRLGVSVVTLNATDFQKISEFRKFNFETI